MLNYQNSHAFVTIQRMQMCINYHLSLLHIRIPAPRGNQCYQCSAQHVPSHNSSRCAETSVIIFVVYRSMHMPFTCCDYTACAHTHVYSTHDILSGQYRTTSFFLIVDHQPIIWTIIYLIISPLLATVVFPLFLRNKGKSKGCYLAL